MNFEPVEFSEGRAPDGAVSATFLRAFNTCARAAFLYQDLRGGPSEPQLERGSALHAAVERGINVAVDNGEPSIPPELLKAIGDEVLADPEFHVPIEEHDLIREGLFRLGSWLKFDPKMVVAVERLMVLEVGGWRIRMKLDYVELLESGAAVLVRDWKSSRHLPGYEELGRRLPDQGRIAAKALQLVLYGLGVMFGRPVLVETNALGERTETILPFPLADRAQRVELEYVFPSIEDRMTDGGPATRRLSLTKTELHEYLESVAGMMARVEHAVTMGEWPAIQGEGHCGECPAPALCPIPERLRKWAPHVDNAEEAAAEAEAIEVEGKALTARRARLRNWVKHQPGQRLRFGRDMVLEPVPQTATEIKDKDGFVEAAQKAADYGDPFEPHKFIKTTASTPIRPRRLTEAEMAEESEDAA